MKNIPSIPNARYTFDFMVFPSLLFNDHHMGFLGALLKEKETAMANLMNNFYKDYAKQAKINIDDEEIFSQEDFSVIAGNIDKEGPFFIGIDMPMDTCLGIICLKHFILFNKENIKPRLFTLEKNSFLDTPFLCEVSPKGKHINYGPAPTNGEELLDKLIKLFNN